MTHPSRSGTLIPRQGAASSLRVGAKLSAQTSPARRAAVFTPRAGFAKGHHALGDTVVTASDDPQLATLSAIPVERPGSWAGP
jgi:hypothetical protein